jgi:hypothetical protein
MLASSTHARLTKLPYDKEEVAVNLYLSGIGEEFIALQLDLEIPKVIEILKSQGVYVGSG